MKGLSLKAACHAGAAGIAMFSAPALAQPVVEQPAAEAQPAETQPAARPQEAAPREEGGNQNDIVVTARRTEERLQDVPISITVFNQERITNLNVTNGTDLATYTPSLSSNSRFGSDNATFSIRGFTAESRTTASVGVYFADVVAPRGGSASIAQGDGAGPGYFFDLQNVQVLKGPQGTLFGRNTTGGAVLFVPQRPTDRLEGYLEGSIGNYDMRRLQGVLNVPLTDNASFRIGADWQQRDGYLNNISGIGPDNFNDINYYTIRASLLVNLTPSLENYTIVSYTESDTNGLAGQVRVCNPAVNRFGQLSCDALARIRASGDPYAVLGSLGDSRSFLRNWQVINTTTWDINDNLTFKNIFSYAQILTRSQGDFFGAVFRLGPTLTSSGVAVPTGALNGTVFQFNNNEPLPGGTSANQENFVEELQLQGRSFNNRLRWQLGLYAEISDPLGTNSSYSVNNLTCSNRFALQCIDPIRQVINAPSGIGSLTVQTYEARYQDYGIYGQGTFEITPQLSFTAGLRYTWDISESNVLNLSYRNFTAAGSPALAICGNTAIRLPSQPFTNPEQCRGIDRQNSDAPTWVVGLDWRPMQDVLLYGKYARGYRQGSVNPLGAGGFTTFDQEQVDTYEIGAKTSWRGAVSGFFNIAGFYNDFTNQQLQQGFIGLIPNAAIVNVGSSRIYGVEIEAGIRPFRGLDLSASYAYINSELVSADDPVLPPGGIFTSFQPLTTGRALPYTPENKLTLTATYVFPLPEQYGELSISGSYTYTDEIISNYTPNGTLPSYELINASLNWRRIGGLPVDLSVFGTNLANTFYTTSNVDQNTSIAFSTYTLGEPRTYGLRLRYNFGR